MPDFKKEFYYRRADDSDFEQLKALGKASYAEFSTVLTKANWDKMNAFLNSDTGLKQRIAQSTVFVCELDSVIIGMIYLVAGGHPTTLFKADWSYIRFLGVHPKQRGKGIGKTLTELCIAHAKDTQETHVALHTSEFMDAARNIYETRGFKKDKTIQYLGKTYWVYLLELD
ncbi:GNAT family N-acetyltransferase [Winogradskyella eckloniae]|uniref:GNAT family N-acetyltransferase n=1 Tax=Winogradskyella eckloniae TaxID=1089306 RepID=UPI0015664505|nr:GNAT family N-acetyltransferase [Winogradskyella eckloniae]NRD19827.1 GNAT family N-acetyltransferase [Winogradskyella eckloniae]